jgi:hypothetical protein
MSLLKWRWSFHFGELQTLMWPTALIATLTLAVIVLAALTLHLIRLERRRSDARVAALAAVIDDPEWETRWEDEERFDEVRDSPPTVSLVVPEVPHPSRAPAFAAAALVILVASGLLVVGMSGGSRTTRHAAAARVSSIELVSMRHALDGETLIVSGIVRNSSTSATPALSAVVSVLGRDGQVVARGESQLDPVVLGPGRETTFRVSVSEVGDPGRYRVAFVNGSQIVPHVDRRSDLSRTALANDARGN